MKISIKTRIGKDEPEEFYELIKIYNKYPIEELIIHPRTQKDFYKNKPNLEIFKYAIENSKNPICYNGDIFTVKDYEEFIKKFPSINTVMLGRGIIANPGLMKEIKEGNIITKDILKDFHDEILEGYLELLDGEKNSLFKMKELWSYMVHIFSDNKKYAKNIKKAQNLISYKQAVSSLFIEQDIVEGAGLFGE